VPTKTWPPIGISPSAGCMCGFDTHFETQEFSRGHDDSQGRLFLKRLSGAIESGTWCLDSPLISAAFGPQMGADLRKSADRRQRKSAVNSSCSYQF